MKTLGFTKVVLLPLMISGTIMGSSIASPIPPLRNPTSEESTSIRRGNPEEEREESQASQTGNDITEALTNLNKILEEWEKRMKVIYNTLRPVLQQLEHFNNPTITANDAFKAVTRYWDRISHPEQIIQSLPQGLP